MIHRRAVFALLSALVLPACSGGGTDSLGGGTNPGPAATTGSPNAGAPNAPSSTTSTGLDGGARDASTNPNVGPQAGRGSGGTGGPAAGEHDVVVAGGAVALHVPPKGTGPMPLVVLLHGQGDTGRNFLNVWLAKGLASNVLIASPDDNTDGNTLSVEQALRGLFDVDMAKRYVLGFSQGGAYASFLLYDASAASRFTAVALASSGLAEDPSSIPMASKKSPAVAVVIDPTDFNNTWNQGRHVMEELVPFLAARGYDTKLWLHDEGHSLAPTSIAAAMTWMLTKEKTSW